MSDIKTPKTREDLDALVAHVVAGHPHEPLDPHSVSTPEKAAEILELGRELVPKLLQLVDHIDAAVARGHDRMTRFECGIMRLAPRIHDHIKPKIHHMSLMYSVIVVTAIAQHIVDDACEADWHAALDADWDAAFDAALEIPREQQMRLVLRTLGQMLPPQSSSQAFLPKQPRQQS